MRPSAIPAATCLICFTMIGCSPATGPAVDREANKNLARQFIEAINAADWGALTAIVADDLVRHSAATPGPAVRSRDDFVALQTESLASFPDQRVTIDALVAEGNLVAVRATYSGTNTGPLQLPTGEVPATGRRVELPFLGVLRIEEGQIREMWVEWDNAAMMAQLGLSPPGNQ